MLLVAVTLGAIRLWPKAPLRDAETFSSAVYAERGELMRLTLAGDEQYRVWTPIDEIAPSMTEAVMRYEDRWFYWHPGVNPAALIRSAYATFSGERRQGGSTLTMQLARRLYDIDSSRVSGKVVQIATAGWLEARYSKREILEAYLNFVPYGGNIEGVGAASLIYFHKRAAGLTLPESLTLAVIPQNPAARGGKEASSRALVAARARLVKNWQAAHPADEKFGTMTAIQPRSVSAMPFRAPHLANQLIKNSNGQEIFSSIDLRMQATLERAITQRIDREKRQGVRNAAALLIDTDTMQAKAMVGSADFFDADINGQVNAIQAKRSPGSTLKPFVYALAFDQGVLHPMTVLKDAPTAFGPFSPENFDGRFVGPITAQEALIRSRNVPAVLVASRLTRPSLYDLLKSSGVSNMASEKHYGLALTLGGGEVTMEELARLYAMLANGGELKPISYQRSGKTSLPGRSQNVRPISDASSFVTLEMLKSNPRPDTGLPAQPAVAWKTGTSWGFRDAWSAGAFGHYVLVVWVGNFDSTSNAAFIGVSAAAPLFFNIVDALRQEGLVDSPNTKLPPQQLSKVEVCAATGDLPNRYCKERVNTWFMPGTSPIRISNLHRRVLIDQRTGLAVCQESATTKWEVYEYWPSDMRRMFVEAGMPRRLPPKAANCGRVEQPIDAPQIVSPLRSVTYTTRIANPVPITLRADGGTGTHFWFANEALIGETKAGEPLVWLPPHAGIFTMRVVDEAGTGDSRDVQVAVVP
jgi:penicillin-binding protein 1C